jgi:cytochrome c oxidase subunit I+III
MTMTESPPAEAAVDEEPTGKRATGIYAALTTTDHKTVGRLYIACSLLFAVGTVVVGVLVGFERADSSQPDDVFLGLNSFFQAWTYYRIAFALFVVMPLLLGVAMVVVPIQIGSTNIAFPRAALGSFWAWLLGSGITTVAVFAGGGWGALDGVTGDERDAIALTLAGTAFTILALLTAALCLATTIISMRTRGMNLLRVPLFAWSMLVAATTWLFTLPILIANLGLIYFDLRGRDPIAFGIPDENIWAQIDWAFTQPAVYALALPVLGIAGDIIPVSAHVRPGRHTVLVTAVGVAGLLSLGGWMQPFMTAPSDHRDEFVYVAFGIAAVLPVLVIFGGMADFLRRGVSSLIGLPATMLLGALGAVLLVLGAVVTGALRVIEPFELLDRTTTTAIFNAVVVGALLGGVAALWYWAPKITGTTLSEGLGRLAVLALLVGGLLLVVPDILSGFFLSEDFLTSDPTESIVDSFNVIAAIGSVVVAVGVLAAVLGATAGLRRSRPAAAADPWHGHTLEWSTPSPPPPGNFAEPPEDVGSELPLLDRAADETDDADDDADGGAD